MGRRTRQEGSRVDPGNCKPGGLALAKGVGMKMTVLIPGKEAWAQLRTSRGT